MTSVRGCAGAPVSGCAGGLPSIDTGGPAYRRTGAPALAWIAALIALWIAGCDSLPGKPTEAERPLRPEQVTDFTALYTANCSGCHGADGTLGAARPLNDPVYVALTGSGRIQAITSVGVAGTAMPGFSIAAGGTLTDQQIEILARGITQRWAGAGVPAGTPLPPYGDALGDAARGAQAYATYCASCHGADGRGSTRGGSVVDGSYLGLVSDQALRSAVIAGRTDLGMPDWRGYVEGRSMSDQEISDVVAWLAAQRPKFPGQPYAANGRAQ